MANNRKSLEHSQEPLNRKNLGFQQQNNSNSLFMAFLIASQLVPWFMFHSQMDYDH